MNKNPVLIVVSVALVILVIVAAVISGDDDGGDLPVGPVTPALGTVTGDSSFRGDAPTAEQDDIYSAVETALSSPDNPANREIPPEFLESDRDEKAFQKWTLETLNNGIEFQQTVFRDVGQKFSTDPDVIASIHINVRDWRQANNIPLD